MSAKVEQGVQADEAIGDGSWFNNGWPMGDEGHAKAPFVCGKFIPAMRTTGIMARFFHQMDLTRRRLQDVPSIGRWPMVRGEEDKGVFVEPLLFES